MKDWQKEKLEKAKKVNPMYCVDCPCIDFSVAEDFGDCLITDEELWNITSERGKKCPLDK